MTELLDGPVVLRADESAVLVHEGPHSSTSFPDIDATARLGTDRPVTVDVRFGRLPAAADLGADVVLVGPADSDTYDGVPVYTVAGPENLTGYGVSLTRVLEEHDAPLFVRIDSLTALLQHVSVNDAFRFVHVLSSRIDREAAVLVASIDPSAHDERTISSMTQPFDVAVTGDEGERRVRRRG